MLDKIYFFSVIILFSLLVLNIMFLNMLVLSA